MTEVPPPVGTLIHGFAGGAFGRDSYACRRVEAVGVDWIVTRNCLGEAEFCGGLSDVSSAVEAGDDRAYCRLDCEGPGVGR